MKQTKLPLIGISLAMMLLILDSKTAFSGAAEGIELCIQTVIPSLFPFFVLSILLTGSMWDFQFLRPIGRLTGIPMGCETVLVSGILGGYPVGAQAVAGMYRSGRLSRQAADRLLRFCSNAGPSFLFGIVAAQFPERKYGWMLWAVQLLSAYLVSIVFPAAETAGSKAPVPHSIHISEAMKKAVCVMASVCGWVVIARVVIAFAQRWILWMFPASVQVAVCGILELTNGCCSLPQIADVNLRFSICSGMLSFGGLCVVMQTGSVIEGLDIRCYLEGKALQTVFSVLISCFVLLPYGFLLAVMAGILVSCLKFRKTSGNPGAVGV